MLRRNTQAGALLVALALTSACSKNVQEVGAPNATKPTQTPMAQNLAKMAQGNAGGAAQAMAPRRPRAEGALKWEAPAAWKASAPRSRLRMAQYELPAKGGDAPSLAIFHFPGMGGSVDANVKRWVGQFKPAAGQPTEPKTEKLTSNGLEITVVSTAGTYQAGAMGRPGGGGAPKPGYALLAAIVVTPQGPWFFKLVGPEKELQAQRADFFAFLKTIRPKTATTTAADATAPASK